MQVQAEQALQNITAAMEQASGHRQEAAVLKKQLADDQVFGSCFHVTDRRQMTAHQALLTSAARCTLHACIHTCSKCAAALSLPFLKPLHCVETTNCTYWPSKLDIVRSRLAVTAQSGL